MSVAADLEQFIVSELTRGRGIDSIAPDEDLLAAGIVDSHGVMELVGAIESRYGIVVPDDDLTPDNFRSLNGIEAYVTAKRGS
jgi:acyl carrier protein